MSYKVKEIADLVGISVRTLHYYDEKGILNPSKMTEAGYRLYDEEDIKGLQQILFFKELDFSLKEIKEIMSDPEFDQYKAMETHHQLLIKKRQRLNNIIKNVEKSMKEMRGETSMSKSERFKVFDMSDIEATKDKYKEEVNQKYKGEKLTEYNQKTAQYSKDQWKVIEEKGNDITYRFSRSMMKEPGAKEVQELVYEYHQYINDSFYTCTKEVLKGLGQMYVADERFTANYDKVKEGLAQFIKEAIDIYVD